MRTTLAALALLAALGAPAAQAAPADSTAADSAARAVRPSGPGSGGYPSAGRLSWLSDRVPLRPGDLITVVVNEQTAASEKVSHIAQGDHGLKADLNAGIASDPRIGPAKSFSSTLTRDSHDEGTAGRQGDLTAVLTVRVVSLEPDGTARVAGSKKVNVDGRLQEIGLKGVVRTLDVSPDNTIPSNRIAEAEITYKGKKIGPKNGFIGNLLGMVWP